MATRGSSEDRLIVGKVGGTVNIADALTKYHSAGKLAALSQPHGVVGAAQTIDTVGPRGGANRSIAKVALPFCVYSR